MTNTITWNPVQYILPSRLERFKSFLGKLNERLGKSGAPLVEVKIGPEELIRKSDGVQFRMLKIELDRSTSNNGLSFKLLARSTIDNITEFREHKTFEKLTPSQMQVLNNPKCPSLCDHCNTNRPRSFMYLIETAGELKRVGSSCLDQFAGVGFKKWSEAYEKVVEELDDLGMIDLSDAQDFSVLSVHDFLCQTIISINEKGFRKSNEPESTGYSVFDQLQSRLSENLNLYFPDEVKETANKVTEFIMLTATDSDKKNNDYYLNLRNLIEFGYLTMRQCGLLARAVDIYNKNIQQQLIINESQNVGLKHVASKGDKLLLKGLKVIHVEPSQNRYSFVTRIRLMDENKNLFSWNATGVIDIERGMTVNLLGTVKDNENYYSRYYGKEVNSTALTRCKFLTEEELELAQNKIKPKRVINHEEGFSPC